MVMVSDHSVRTEVNVDQSGCSASEQLRRMSLEYVR